MALTKKKKIWIGASAGAVVLIAAMIVLLIMLQIKPAVQTAVVTAGNIEARFETTGTLQSDNTKQYVTVTQAVVEHVNVKEGDSVTQGQVMATFDVISQQLQYDQARLQYENAKLALADATDGKGRIEKAIAELDVRIAEVEKRLNSSKQPSEPSGGSSKTLAELIDEIREKLDGAENQEEIEALLRQLEENITIMDSEAIRSQLEALSQSLGSNVEDMITLIQLQSQKASLEASRVTPGQIEQAKNAVELAKTAFDAADTALQEAKDGIVATADGVVSAVNLVEGAPPPTTAAAIIVEDFSNVDAVLTLGKYEVESVRRGQPATVTFKDVDYPAEVSFVSPVATTQVGAAGTTSSVTVKVKLKKPGQDITLGLEADVSILTGSAQNVIVIPSKAVKSDEDGKWCYVVRDGTLRRTAIETGLDSGTQQEVKSGLQAGDIVVLDPADDLKDGDQVKESK